MKKKTTKAEAELMWFDRADGRAMFVDKRCETHLAKDCSVTNGWH